MNPRASSVKYNGSYKLLVTFVNNEVKLFDLTNYLNYPIYAPLRDGSFCEKVKVVDGIVQWDDEIDLDPDTLYLESRSLPLQIA